MSVRPWRTRVARLLAPESPRSLPVVPLPPTPPWVPVELFSQPVDVNKINPHIRPFRHANHRGTRMHTLSNLPLPHPS